MKVVVAGGGISGLVAAFRLQEAGHDVLCVEPAERPGGAMRTERKDGFLCELGPEAILDSSVETRALVADLGLTPEAVRPPPSARRRLIYVRGKLRALPSDPFALLTTDLLSAGGKWRLLREPWVKPTRGPEGEAGAEGGSVDSGSEPAMAAAAPEDESVLAFAERRLGPEAARSVVAPAVIGIYGADAARLSLRSAFPRLHALEVRHGSLLRGLRAARKEGGPGGRMLSFRDGLERLPRALADRLGGRLLRARVLRIARDATATPPWTVEVAASAGDAGGRRLTADAVVLATPAPVTADLLAPFSAAAAAALREIPIAPAAVVFLGFRDARATGVDLDAYGFLVARGEGPQILGCQYETTVFAGRGPEGSALLRVIVGGSFHPEALDESDEALCARAREELAIIAGLRAAPDFTFVHRVRGALPQYHIGHEARVGAVDAALASLPGLHAIGYALRGVGVNDCIRTATTLARKLAGG